ncbi:hypothetical protein J3458_000449 [Metarhizium acridum]|uniref:uncharacterized protein n=1 Tax=Metarhizium acridum TaxID=92637 RepID=UPI001C6BD203|nr:hypothetical protein J3458_000449 [Metarhizium acridum]
MGESGLRKVMLCQIGGPVDCDGMVVALHERPKQNYQTRRSCRLKKLVLGPSKFLRYGRPEECRFRGVDSKQLGLAQCCLNPPTYKLGSSYPRQSVPLFKSELAKKRGGKAKSSS